MSDDQPGLDTCGSIPAGGKKSSLRTWVRRRPAVNWIGWAFLRVLIFVVSRIVWAELRVVVAAAVMQRVGRRVLLLMMAPSCLRAS